MNTIALLYGGDSPEHEVSLHSASAVYQGLIAQSYTVIPISVGKNGIWQREDATEQELLSQQKMPLTVSTENNPERRVWTMPQNGLWTHATAPYKLNVDCVCIMIHGGYGENGIYQGMLESATLPYTGSGIFSSALCMAKHHAKQLWMHNSLPVLPFVSYHVDKQEAPSLHQFYDQCKKELGFPVMIKPSRGGSSLGAAKAEEDFALFSRIVQNALHYDNDIIAETFLLQGREIEVALIDSVVDSSRQIKVFPFGEIIVPNHAVYDYEKKYSSPESVELKVPAILPEKTESLIREYALHAYRISNCRAFARIDFFLSPDNEIYLNEINTIPGFTKTSLFPLMAMEGGLSFPMLMDTIVHSSIAFFSQ